MGDASPTCMDGKGAKMESQETFVTELLDSGLRVVGQPMVGVESAAIGFLVGAGARDDSPRAHGVSHFTEQMLVRGTHRFDARQLSDRFDSLGISYDTSAGIEMSIVNAVLLGDRWHDALELLGEVVFAPTFPEESVDNVRSVLLQEIRQREDQPAQKVFDLARRQLFAGSPLAHDVLGSEESIDGMTRRDLVEYWTQRYTVPNSLVSIAGKFDWDGVVARLTELSKAWPGIGSRTSVESPASSSSVLVVERDTNQEHLGFALPAVSASDPDYYVAALFAQVVGGISVSRLWREVREKRGLAYAVQARFDGLEKSGLFRVYCGTSADRAHESVEVILDELRGVRTNPITEAELHLAKTKLKSQFVMRSESTSARMVANLRSWWFEERLRPLGEVSERIEHVSVQDVQRLVERLDIPNQLAAVAVGPRKEDELFGHMLARS